MARIHPDLPGQSANKQTRRAIDQEIARLEQHFARRQQQNRPISHSVATAYRLAIAKQQDIKKDI